MAVLTYGKIALAAPLKTVDCGDEYLNSKISKSLPGARFD
jgi:hypothetical protein